MAKETREIKIRSFVYEEEFTDFDGEKRKQNRQARRGETVELDPYWIRYGEDMGAFMTDADREAEVDDESVLETAETVEEMGDDELMNWVSDSTIPQVLAVAKADPSLCERILVAENAATGNDPRSGLVDALARIVGSGEATTSKADTDPAKVEPTEPEAPAEEETVDQLAERLGVDLEKVEGTGDEDSVTVDDVKEYYDDEIANATDGAVELAEEEDLFLADVTGTGQDGRITKDDVQRYIDAQNAATTA